MTWGDPNHRGPIVAYAIDAGALCARGAEDLRAGSSLHPAVLQELKARGVADRLAALAESLAEVRTDIEAACAKAPPPPDIEWDDPGFDDTPDESEFFRDVCPAYHPYT